MREVLRTNNLILISRVQSILNNASIQDILLDNHTSNIEGSIGAIQRRLVVSDNDFQLSQRLIRDIVK
jgi:hypothetical protein